MFRRAHVFGFVLLALAAAPSFADLYGYVDERGAHLSDLPLDPRYRLFMKSPEAEPATAAALTAPAPAPVAAAKPKTVKLLPQTRASRRYATLIARIAREHEVEPALLHAVVRAESQYNARARSPRGATGLMQLMPATAKQYGVTDLQNPAENLRAGARYLNDLLDRFDNNLKLVLAAYNAGEGAVRRSGNSIPPYPETRAYVPRVLEYYESYRALTLTSPASDTRGGAGPVL